MASDPASARSSSGWGRSKPQSHDDTHSLSPSCRHGVYVMLPARERLAKAACVGGAKPRRVRTLTRVPWNVVEEQLIAIQHQLEITAAHGVHRATCRDGPPERVRSACGARCSRMGKRSMPSSGASAGTGDRWCSQLSRARAPNSGDRVCQSYQGGVLIDRAMEPCIAHGLQSLAI